MIQHGIQEPKKETEKMTGLHRHILSMLLDSSKFSHDYTLCLREFFGNNKVVKVSKKEKTKNKKKIKTPVVIIISK
jgi:hypothetical protein